jgi:hypothetical protein
MAWKLLAMGSTTTMILSSLRVIPAGLLSLSRELWLFSLLIPAVIVWWAIEPKLFGENIKTPKHAVLMSYIWRWLLFAGGIIAALAVLLGNLSLYGAPGWKFLLWCAAVIMTGLLAWHLEMSE